MVQDSVSDWSHAWLFSNSPRLPVRSWRAPAAAYLETRVLPSSTTSGVLELDLDGVVGVGLLPLGVDGVDHLGRGASLHQPDGHGAGPGLGGGLVTIPARVPTGGHPEDQGDGEGEDGGETGTSGLGHEDLPPCCWDGRWSLGRGAAGGCRPAGEGGAPPGGGAPPPRP